MGSNDAWVTRSVGKLAPGLIFALWLPSALGLDCADHLYRRGGATAEAPTIESFLLELTPADVPPSYLLGTFHSADPQVLETWEPAALLLGVSTARLFIGERDLGVGVDLSAQRLEDEKNLSAVLAPHDELFESTAAVLSQRGFPVATVDRLQPWFAAALLEQTVAGAPGDRQVLDAYLQNAAVGLGLQTRFLESFSELARRYDQNFSQQEQIALLWESACNQEQLAKLVAAQSDAYAANDVLAFQAEAARFSSRNPGLAERLREVLVRQRDEAFWALVWPEIRRGGALVAVGNAHVLSPSGLLERLRTEAPDIEIRSIDPSTLRFGLGPDDVPGIADWTGDWLRDHGAEFEVESSFHGLTLTSASIATLRQGLCPGRRCTVEATYRGEEPAVLLTTELFARLMASSRSPAFELGVDGFASTGPGPARQDPYVDSLVVRELTRHALTRQLREALRRRRPERPPAADCAGNWVLHWATRAQQQYLREAGSRLTAHPFPLDPRCGAFGVPR